MDGDHAGFNTKFSQIAFGGAGISGRFMGYGGELQTDDTWFYLEDIDGIGGSSGSEFVFTGNPGNPTPQFDAPEVNYAKNGLAGGGGGELQVLMDFIQTMVVFKVVMVEYLAAAAVAAATELVVMVVMAVAVAVADTLHLVTLLFLEKVELESSLSTIDYLTLV